MAQILIDGYNLDLVRGTGVATYARNLSHELKALGHSVSVLYGKRATPSREGLMREIGFFDDNVSKPNRWLEILNQAHRALLGPLGHAATEVPMTGRVIKRTFEARMPAYDVILNSTDVFKRSQSAFRLWNSLSTVSVPQTPDLVHWTYPVPMQIKRAPNIYTMHDLVPLRLPYTTLDRKQSYLCLMRKIAKAADHIVTVSECSRKDLINLLNISPDRVTNTYQSVYIPNRYRRKPEEIVAQEVEGITGVGYKDYFLFWGSIEPKKNIAYMIEAYLSSGVDAPLVIVGAQAWKSEQELRMLNDEVIRYHAVANGQIHTKKRVIQLSYAPFSLLVSLIRGAKAALFPSLYEGFGLPALEAMLLGTPVICSNTSSLPEVAGEAALMVDPYDVASLSEAIRTIDEDRDLRSELSRRGICQAEKFSPHRYRENLKSLYARFI